MGPCDDVKQQWCYCCDNIEDTGGMRQFFHLNNTDAIKHSSIRHLCFLKDVTSYRHIIVNVASVAAFVLAVWSTGIQPLSQVCYTTLHSLLDLFNLHHAGADNMNTSKTSKTTFCNVGASWCYRHYSNVHVSQKLKHGSINTVEISTEVCNCCPCTLPWTFHHVIIS